jgi:uncharacterized damage-inducible protein DinB
MSTDLLEAWRMSNEANLFLLSKLPSAALKDAYGSRTRDVAAQFAHMHAVRLRWLGHASPAHAAGVKKLSKDVPSTKAQLSAALRASERAVAGFLAESAETGKVKKWRGGPATFLSYLVAHEAHHRALAMVALRLSGHPPDKEVVYGLWDWGKGRCSR